MLGCNSCEIYMATRTHYDQNITNLKNVDRILNSVTLKQTKKKSAPIKDLKYTEFVSPCPLLLGFFQASLRYELPTMTWPPKYL